MRSHRNVAIGIAATGLLTFATLLAASGIRAAEGASSAATAGRPSTLKPLGSVWIDQANRSVVATGSVNQAVGLVELLACGRGGKLHESVLMLELNPLDLQTALILLGAKGGRPMKDVGVEPPEGTALGMDIVWTQGVHEVSVPAGDLIMNVQRNKETLSNRWIFTGSVVAQGKFMATEQQSWIATYWDPWAVINLADPAGADDTLIFVNTNKVPAVGTPVRAVIRIL